LFPFRHISVPQQHPFPMIIQHNISLKSYNTFGIAATANAFCSVTSMDDLEYLFSHDHLNTPNALILGGGSNILLTKNLDALVVKIALKGINIIREDTNTVTIEVAAGELWDDVVQYAVSKNWCGLENLSLIPGSMGAAPVQNIGAYSVELKDVIVCVKGMMRSTGELREISALECAFAYRDSIFKRDLRDQYVITSVVMRLLKNPRVQNLHLEYGALRQELRQLFPTAKPDEYTIAHVREAVCQIRRSKLPDPAIIGNAGSFFKNPEVPFDHYTRIKSQYSDVPFFPAHQANTVKIPAGWMIEQCAWKGKHLAPNSDAAVHDKQALVLVNHGTADGMEILELSQKIRASVEERFGIRLEMEVNAW
jgi:UDP-N-acetylmuramate dehydrogenase